MLHRPTATEDTAHYMTDDMLEPEGDTSHGSRSAITVLAANRGLAE